MKYLLVVILISISLFGFAQAEDSSIIKIEQQCLKAVQDMDFKYFRSKRQAHLKKELKEDFKGLKKFYQRRAKLLKQANQKESECLKNWDSFPYFDELSAEVNRELKDSEGKWIEKSTGFFTSIYHLSEQIKQEINCLSN